MYKESILIPQSMGTLETGFRGLGLNQVTDKRSLRKAVLASVLAVGVSLGGTACAETYTETERPLQAIPEYSDNQEGWRELYQAQIDESLEYKDALLKFLYLRMADLGFDDPGEAPGSLRRQAMSDYNDWQSLVWKDKTNTDTDKFLADLASNN